MIWGAFMRECLGIFRGKRIDTSKWVEGNYVFLKGCEVHKDLHLIIDEHGEYHIVDPDTVGEYAGLNDKTNNPIFEGDIIKRANELRQIIFDREVSAFGYRYGEDYDFCYLGDIAGSLQPGEYYKSEENRIICPNLEIVGNIHDNPYLLKEVKQNED